MWTCLGNRISVLWACSAKIRDLYWNLMLQYQYILQGPSVSMLCMKAINFITCFLYSTNLQFTLLTCWEIYSGILHMLKTSLRHWCSLLCSKENHTKGVAFQWSACEQDIACHPIAREKAQLNSKLHYFMGFAWFSSNGKLQISSVGTKLALLHYDTCVNVIIILNLNFSLYIAKIFRTSIVNMVCNHRFISHPST